MSDGYFLDENQDSKPEPTYLVGYGKPPVHARFKPGQSGNKGRRDTLRPNRESRVDLVKRIRDEKIKVQGKSMTMLELAVRQTFTTTIKSGKARDLKALFDLLDKYGVGITHEENENITPEDIAKRIMRAIEVSKRITES
jgi:hypothetical protein